MQEIKLGDIVALKSHPFTATNTDVIISGDAQHISPLMIVVETLIESKNIYDEQTGDLKGKKQCKCIWFSNHNFEEAWISSEHLKVIKSEEESKEEKEIAFEIGSFVSLKTLEIELGKKKSTLKTQGYGTKEVSMTALLSFVPPVLQVTGRSKNESKEPIFDAKTGVRKRYISKDLIKCKWYNPTSNKISEKLLPTEALQIIPPVNQEFLKKIKPAKYLKIENGNEYTLVKSQEVSFKCGLYHLVAFNYLTQKNDEFAIHEISSVESLDNYYIKKFPDFEALKNDFREKNIDLDKDNTIKLAKKKKNYIVIEYKNKNAGFSTRTIREFKIVKVKVGDRESDTDTYLVGYCMARKEIRHFALSRIEKIYVLDLSYEA